MVIARETSGAEAIIQFDKDLKHLVEFIQRDNRAIVLGTLRILASIAKNSYKRVNIL